MPDAPGSRRRRDPEVIRGPLTKPPDCQNDSVSQVRASATIAVSAPPERVMAFLRDYRQSREGILPDNYTAYRVEQGGEGSGTVIAYHFSAGGRERDYRLRASELDGALLERDEFSSFVNTWRVAPSGTGSSVMLEATWTGAGGIGGVFERLFAPLGLRRIYSEILNRLAAALQG
jgi:Polyketide cyclase / dehydrase and lipid transport